MLADLLGVAAFQSSPHLMLCAKIVAVMVCKGVQKNCSALRRVELPRRFEQYTQAVDIEWRLKILSIENVEPGHIFILGIKLPLV